MSLASDDLEHVIVVPRGFLAPAAEAGLATVYQKPPFVIPLALDIGRRKGKRDPDGVGMGASVTVA